MSEGERRGRKPGAGEDHDGSQDGDGGNDPGGSPRPDALIPALDKGQLAALREVGREWDRVSADPQVWREALPVDPALGGQAEEREFRPARLSRVVSVAGRIGDGELRPIET